MKRLTYEYIKSEFEKEGYELLSTAYINSHHKLNYKCPEGHTHRINWSDWHQNKRCPVCSLERRASKRRLDIEFVRKEFEREGYILLIDNYVNVDRKLDFICPNGHKGSMNYHNFKSGWRCIKCRIERQKLLCGPRSPQWKGGVSCEPYCDAWADKEFKKDILDRDGYKCQNPRCSKDNSVLCIHHIDYNKKNCHPRNLITLCKSCNSRANYDREQHEGLYRKILKNKYNYKEV